MTHTLFISSRVIIIAFFCYSTMKQYFQFSLEEVNTFLAHIVEGRRACLC